MSMTTLILLLLTALVACAQDAAPGSSNDRAIEREIRRLMDYELGLVLRSDVAAMQRFYPDDTIVTNPFNQLIGKEKILERVRSNIIRYSSYEKKIEHLGVHGDTVIVMGLEIVRATEDADRPDAGRTVRRRFTEVWMLRNGSWQKMARHASNIGEAP